MTTAETIRSQLHTPTEAKGELADWLQSGTSTTQAVDGIALMTVHLSTHDAIKVQLDAGLQEIKLLHAGGTVTLTPEQGRKVLAGHELTVVLGKVVIK